MSSPYPILIGIGQRSLNYEPFQGDIDDVRIYARALKDCDVDSLYKLPNPTITGVSEKNENENMLLYPNPYISTIEIKYKLNNSSIVNLEVYNLLGENTKTLIHNQKQSASEYVYSIGDEFNPGIYLVKLKINDKTYIRKIFKIRSH